MTGTRAIRFVRPPAGRRAAMATLLLIPLLAAGCARPPAGSSIPIAAAARVTKPVSFAVLEDYDKGQDLEDVARDFELLNELDVRVMRCSLGWDDYEPERGRTDFEWLGRFVDEARRHGIQLRPYIGYTPKWAGAAGTDDQDWNNPPADYADWEDFVYRLASTLKRHPNVLSYEIYNEEDSREWWDGDASQYAETLRRGAAAIRRADPRATILLGGLIFPDPWWLREIAEAGAGRSFDITPIHAYPETWTPDSVRLENYLGARFRDRFVPCNDSLGGHPIWINETGFATTAGKTERDQANWWARAFATFLSEPRIEEIGIYEIKDLAPQSAAIGGEANYHLGLTRVDRTKKLAFYTVDLLTDLLDTGTITIADSDLRVRLRSGQPRDFHAHLFLRPDGKRVLFVWDNLGSPAIDVDTREPASAAFRCALDGGITRSGSFSNGTLRGLALVPGEVQIFRLDP